ncbi:MAG: FAD-binding oxidoreductase [Proteobacteria bacterium]|jgi:gamma-glutamylputrescine oxidase|nr:FAD-binding oxidoreductase [Pseudomonadota bacterium]MDA0908273.1 FAD-binding oxidoreductase [Pseudomonadota bacterium]MDA1320536.1 FAD-binding oxidoreductase [Pseudomonadota bacterium]
MNLLFQNDSPGQYPDSWYAATTTHLDAQPQLIGSETADVVIIGAGFTGLTAALHLAKRGYDVRVVEAHRIGFGASGRNGGQVGSGQRLEQDQLEKQYGLAMARQLWDLAEDAKAEVAGLIKDHDIACHYRPGIAHACWRKKEVAEDHRYIEKLSRDYGYDKIKPLNKDQLFDLVGSPVYQGGSLDEGAGHIHPLAYVLGLGRAALAAGVVVYENSVVTKVSDGKQPVISTDQGQITTNQVIFACNGYLGKLNRQVSRMVMPINNFIVATEPLGKEFPPVLSRDIAVADSRFVLSYFRRSHDHRLIFGGGENVSYRFPSDIRQLVSKRLFEIYPQLKGIGLDYAWGGTLAITVNRMPCFIRLGDNKFSASGYSGHGVAMATLAGRMLAEAAAGISGGFDVMEKIKKHRFPGGDLMRWPLLVLGMKWYMLRDRLGF